jgi:hypothetical protein
MKTGGIPVEGGIQCGSGVSALEEEAIYGDGGDQGRSLAEYFCYSTSSSMIDALFQIGESCHFQ